VLWGGPKWRADEAWGTTSDAEVEAFVEGCEGADEVVDAGFGGAVEWREDVWN
jgi:hypothetical protein